MATISNTLALQDKMTPTLSKVQQQAIQNIDRFNKMNESIKAIKKSMEEAEKANPEIVSSEMYSSAVEGLAAMEAKLYDVAHGEADLTEEVEENTLSIVECNQALEILNKAWSAFTGVISKANEYIEMNNNQFNQEFLSATKLHNVLGMNSDEIKSVYDYASALQEVGVVGDEATLAGVQTLSVYTSSKKQLQELIPYMNDLAVNMNGLNTNQASVEQTAALLGRALQGNSRALKTAGILTDEQADYINKLSTEEQRADALMKIFNGTIKGTNEALAKTAQGGIMQANNALGDMQEKLGESLTPYLYAFKNAIVDLLAPAVQFLADNMNTIAPILLVFAGVIGVVITALTLYTTWNAIAAVSEMALFWPIMLVVGAILLVIGAIYLIVRAYNYWTNSSVSAVGVICGIFMTLVAFIYNNVILPLWNIFASVANFLANIFIDPIASIKILFIDLAKTAITVLNQIAQAIDFLFGSNFADTTSSWLSSLDSLKDNIKKESDYKEVMGTLNSWNYSDAYSSGYKFGSNISDGISNAVGGLDVNNLLGNLDSTIGMDSTGAKALKTTSNDNLLSDDDIQLLLDVATRDYKLSYQQVTPNITLTFGDVRETADVDDILDQVADRLEEIYDGNLEVAY